MLGDGAHWIWPLAEEHFPEGGHIVDYWHATAHLWARGRALYGATDARVVTWVQQAREQLRAGAVRDFLAEWATLVPKDAAAVAAEYTSFRNQAARMRYEEYRAAGYPLGSGAVESAKRHVVGVRVKQAGMRWTAAGVTGVLARRALLRSQRWATWWAAQPLPLVLAA